MKNLRTLRTAANRTQMQMAKFLGITQQAYAAYENKKAQPPIDIAKKLAVYFNVSLDYLLDGDENSTSPPTIENDEIRLIAKDMQELNPEALKTIKDLISQLRGKGGDIKPNE